MPLGKVIVRGEKLEIVAASDDSGRSPVEEFLRGLAADRKKKAVLARFTAAFRLLADEGRIHNVDVFKKISESLWEFRSGAARILGGRVGRCFLLTTAFWKKSQKTPKNVMATAANILRREQSNAGREGDG